MCLTEENATSVHLCALQAETAVGLTRVRSAPDAIKHAGPEGYPVQALECLQVSGQKNAQERTLTQMLVNKQTVLLLLWRKKRRMRDKKTTEPDATSHVMFSHNWLRCWCPCFLVRQSQQYSNCHLFGFNWWVASIKTDKDWTRTIIWARPITWICLEHLVSKYQERVGEACQSLARPSNPFLANLSCPHTHYLHSTMLLVQTRLPLHTSVLCGWKTGMIEFCPSQAKGQNPATVWVPKMNSTEQELSPNFENILKET